MQFELCQPVAHAVAASGAQVAHVRCAAQHPPRIVEPSELDPHVRQVDDGGKLAAQVTRDARQPQRLLGGVLRSRIVHFQVRQAEAADGNQPAEPGVLGQAEQILRRDEVAPGRREHTALGVGLRREDVERDDCVGFAEAFDGQPRLGNRGVEIEAGLGIESRQQQPELAPAHFGRRANLVGHGVRVFERRDGLVGVSSLQFEHASHDQRSRQRACGHRPAPADARDRSGGLHGPARPLVGLGGEGQAPRIGCLTDVEWTHRVRGGVEKPLSQTLLDKRDVCHFATGIPRWAPSVKPSAQVVCRAVRGVPGARTPRAYRCPRSLPDPPRPRSPRRRGTGERQAWRRRRRRPSAMRRAVAPRR